jgi:hypothetical protein
MRVCGGIGEMRRGKRSAVILGVCGIAVLVFAYLVAVPYASWLWEGRRARARGRVEACMRRLDDIGLGIRAYRAEHDGNWPGSLAELVPRYMTQIPRCPSASSDLDTYTYSAPVSPDDPERSVIRCDGHDRDARAGGWHSEVTVVLTAGLAVEVRERAHPAN